ncbi:porin [Moraxella sp. ZJ142]|uniref:porin n=1 Tax=Moraxella marmotae TaxID=3344520 RepID=UPI0035D3EC0F
MKKLVLATAIAALSVTAAQAAPTVYGKAFLTLDAVDGNDNSSVKDSRTQLNSNASRIGLKGSEALTANTDLVYKLEYRVDIDADTQQFKSRDTYLGLSNKTYGTLLAGRLTAIDDFVNYANVTEGGVLGGDNVLASFDAPRANNTFAYVSPKYNGLTASAMYVLDENNATDNLGRDAFGVAVQYEPEAAYRAGASYIQAGDLKAIRVSGSYDVTPAATVGALYQNTARGKDLKKENAFTVSGTYKVAQTPWSTYGQVDVVDNVEGAENTDAQRLVLGGKYAFNKQTTGHLYSAYLREKDSHDTAKSYGIGGGLEYKF